MNNPAALTSRVASASLVRQLLADTVQLLPVGKVGGVIHEALSDVYADQMRVVRKTFAAPSTPPTPPTLVRPPRLTR